MKNILSLSKEQYTNYQKKFKMSGDLYYLFPDEIKPLVFLSKLKKNINLNNTYVQLSGYNPKKDSFIIEKSNISIKEKNMIFIS